MDESFGLLGTFCEFAWEFLSFELLFDQDLLWLDLFTDYLENPGIY
jgi:hypothetical protein